MAGRVRRKKFLEESVVLALLDATKGERFESRDLALLGLTYAGGLRVGEVARLFVHEILWEDSGVVVVGKGWRPRFVPIADQALQWLRAYLGPRDRGPVFLAEHSGPMSDRLIRRVVDKYARKGKIVKISPHTLRHSCASHLLARGMYLPKLSEFLGHKLYATTAIYLHEVPVPVDMAGQYQAAHPLSNAPG